MCVGFSIMGQGFGWLHPSSLSCIIWAFAMRSIKPNAIVHECVPGASPAILQDLLGPEFKVSSTCFSPTDQGVPTTRPRRYSIAHLKEKYPGIVELDFDVFRTLTFRRLIVDGNIYFTMPGRYVQAAFEHSIDAGVLRASIHGPPSATALHHSKRFCWDDFLSTTERARLGQYRGLLAADFNGCGHKVHFVQISQNSDWFSDVSSLIPTLMRSSVVWRIVPTVRYHADGSPDPLSFDERFDRPLLPEEYLAAQGMPVPVLLPSGHPMGDGRCTLSKVFQSGMCTASQYRQLAGNAMHVCSVGSVLLFALMSLPKDP